MVLLASDFQNILELYVFTHAYEWVLNCTCISGSNPDQHTEVNFTAFHEASFRSFVMSSLESDWKWLFCQYWNKNSALHTRFFCKGFYLVFNSKAAV